MDRKTSNQFLFSLKSLKRVYQGVLNLDLN
jgi:hypothetical protein